MRIFPYSLIFSDNSDEVMLKQLVESLLEVIMNGFEDTQTRGWIINALAKLSSCKGFTMQQEVVECFEYYSDSKNADVGSRTTEY